MGLHFFATMKLLFIILFSVVYTGEGCVDLWEDCSDNECCDNDNVCIQADKSYSQCVTRDHWSTKSVSERASAKISEIREQIDMLEEKGDDKKIEELIYE